jgi:cell division protein FtsQ
MPGTRQRFEERARQVRRRPWRLAAIGAIALVVVLTLFWVIAISPLLAVRSVTVSGLTDPTERAAALTAARIPMRTPLARVDTAAAAARVEAIATVDRVAVVRTWPNTITVEVTRRAPVLAVKNPQGQLQVVDATGTAYETVAVVPPGIPVVNATSASPDPQGLLAAIGVLTILPADLRGTVSGITVSSADLVTLTLGGVTVVWGGSSDGPKKLAILRVLLGTKPGTIDVSAPDTPVTR